jgi:hypothetical protein
MKLVALLLILLLVAAAVLAAMFWARRTAGRRAVAGAWRLEEVSDGEMLIVRAVRPGDEALLVGGIPFASADFDMRIEEVRAEGRYKLAALNSGREGIGR